MELYGFMEREKKIPSYFFIITKSKCCLKQMILIALASTNPRPAHVE